MLEKIWEIWGYFPKIWGKYGKYGVGINPAPPINYFNHKIFSFRTFGNLTSLRQRQQMRLQESFESMEECRERSIKDREDINAGKKPHTITPVIQINVIWFNV